MRLKYVIVEISWTRLFLEYQMYIYHIACKSLFLTNTDQKQDFYLISLIEYILDF